MTVNEPAPETTITVEDLAHALRLCEVCFEKRRVIAKVGPFLIKEPCKNGCAGGYVQKSRTKESQ